jgi:hypothetical protein
MFFDCTGLLAGLVATVITKVPVLVVFLITLTSVADPDPNPSDPYVSGPQGSGSGSFYHQAKIVSKTLIPTVL